MWCPAARCCRLRRVVCLCVGSHRNSHCVRTAGAVPAGSVAAHALSLWGRVVVYARVVVCEDYLTNTLINTQRGVSPSSHARGTPSETVKHTPISRERAHTDPMCRARPALPQARNDPSCAPCAYARKHMRLLTSYSSTLRHTPPEDSASTPASIGVEVLPPEPRLAKPSTIHSMKRGTAASAAACVPKSRGSKGAAP